MTAKELKSLRVSLGLTQAEAARQVEVTERTWQRWEAKSRARAAPARAIKLFKLVNGIRD